MTMLIELRRITPIDSVKKCDSISSVDRKFLPVLGEKEISPILFPFEELPCVENIGKNVALLKQEGFRDHTHGVIKMPISLNPVLPLVIEPIQQKVKGEHLPGYPVSFLQFEFRLYILELLITRF